MAVAKYGASLCEVAPLNVVHPLTWSSIAVLVAPVMVADLGLFPVWGQPSTVVHRSVVASDSPTRQSLALVQRDLVVSGQPRFYLEAAPVGPAPPGGWPLVLMVHGGGGSASSFADQSRMHDVGEAEGFLTVYGDSLASGWTVGDTADPSGSNELPYFDALLADVQARHSIDPHRRYVSGHSNGGVMSHILVHHRPGIFSGIATVSSGIEAFMLEFPDPGLLAVGVLRGTQDPVVPFGGGIQFGGRPVVSASAVLDYWRTRYGLSPTPTSQTTLPPGPAEDNTSTVVQDFGPAPNGARLRFWRVDNGGHGWPGSNGGGLPPAVIGITVQDYQASEQVWAFFEQSAQVTTAGLRVY